MKRLCLSLLCLALLLSGCSNRRAAGQYAQFAENLNSRRDLSFTADLRAEYADKTVEFRLAYEEEEDACVLRVLESEEIAGVSLRLSPDGAQLSLDGISLDTGPLDRYGLSPVSALPALTAALRAGHLESSWEEGGSLVWELAADDNLTVEVWLDAELVPQHAELISEGRVAVFVEIGDWSFG